MTSRAATRDPAELTDLAGAEPVRRGELETLRAEWNARNEKLREQFTVEQPELSQEEMEQLRALGYTDF